VKIVQFRRELINKVTACGGILRVAAIDTVSGEDRRIAKVFEPTAAIGAISINTANPRNTDAGAERQLGRSAAFNYPYDLVAGDESFLSRRQFPLDEVEIRTADTAGANPKKDLAGRGPRLRSVFDK
jgi:hypothetical protein